MGMQFSKSGPLNIDLAEYQRTDRDVEEKFDNTFLSFVVT
jgi:hypothetical protein